MNFYRRLCYALDILCYRRPLVEPKDSCRLPHIMPNHTAILNDHLAALEQATDELKFALGFIAHSETKQYAEAVVKVISKEKRA